MERWLTEEKVTKALMAWLERLGWTIICYDFPQSGTGKPLKTNISDRTTKNKGTIIPDIVAIKDKTVVFFENKDRFVFDDFRKLHSIKSVGNYSEAIEKLLSRYNYTLVYYGIGIPATSNNVKKTLLYSEMIDFAVFVESDLTVVVGYSSALIFN